METSIDSARDSALPKLTHGALALRAHALSKLHDLEWLAPLAGRLAIGLLFVGTGWGKVHDLDKVTEFFGTLHIPWPAFHAVLVGYAELLCGAAIVIGLLTRLATIPLIVSMVVAIITARADDVGGLIDLVSLEEFTYLTGLVMLVISGPGRVAIDDLLARRFSHRGP